MRSSAIFLVRVVTYNDEDGAYRTYLREQFPVAATGTNCVIYDLQGE